VVEGSAPLLDVTGGVTIRRKGRCVACRGLHVLLLLPAYVWYRQHRQAKSSDISRAQWEGTRRGWLAAVACLHRLELRPCCQLLAQSGVSHIVVGVAQCGGLVAALTCVLGGGRGACALGTVWVFFL